MKAFSEIYGKEMLILALALLLIAWMAACGTETKKAEPVTPRPRPEADTAWNALKPIVDANCGGCHNGTTHPLKFDSGAAFKGSKAKVRISNGSMPPTGALSPDVKAKMLAYLG